MTGWHASAGKPRAVPEGGGKPNSVRDRVPWGGPAALWPFLWPRTRARDRSNLPGPQGRRAAARPGACARGPRTLFGLAPDGVCRAGPLPDRWCALTAPFHPCPRRGVTLSCPAPRRRFAFCCTFRPLRALALPGILPCGVRTFLRPGCPVRRPHHHPSGTASKPLQAGRARASPILCGWGSRARG